MGLQEAVEQGSKILFGDSTDSETVDLDIASAFHRTLSASSGSAEHKRHQFEFADYFLRWCDQKRLTHWRQLRLELLREYVNELIGRGLKAKTISHYLEPVRSTSSFLAANWPDEYRDICRPLRLPAHAGRDGVYRGDEGNPVLSYKELLKFLEWLKGYEWKAILVPAVMLQGVCGLQLREALRLRWSDVDLQAGTITIQDHPEFGERVKNKYRVRCIPVPRIVLKYLQQMNQGTATVVPYDRADKAYGKLLKRTLQNWKSDCELAPKDLRNTLQSHAIEHAADEGWNVHLVDRYVGHAPKTIAERHYFGDKRERLVDLFREHVVCKVDALIESLEGAELHDIARNVKIVEFKSLKNAG